MQMKRFELHPRTNKKIRKSKRSTFATTYMNIVFILEFLGKLHPKKAFPFEELSEKQQLPSDLVSPIHQDEILTTKFHRKPKKLNDPSSICNY